MSIYKLCFDRESYLAFNLDVEDAQSKMGDDFIFGFNGKSNIEPLKERWIQSNCSF